MNRIIESKLNHMGITQTNMADMFLKVTKVYHNFECNHNTTSSSFVIYLTDPDVKIVFTLLNTTYLENQYSCNVYYLDENITKLFFNGVTANGFMTTESEFGWCMYAICDNIVAECNRLKDDPEFAMVYFTFTQKYLMSIIRYLVKQKYNTKSNLLKLITVSHGIGSIKLSRQLAEELKEEFKRLDL
jgi:hypothetical protein